MLCHVLAEEGERVWLAFRHPVASADGARLSTVYAVISGDEAVLIDPGGPADFGPLLAALSDKIDLTKIKGVVLTQVGVQTAGSVGLWAEVLGYDTPIYAAEIARPDLLHVDRALQIHDIPENGGEVPMTDGSGLHLLPAPYLPSAASLSLYDPVARVLYTGDIGTAEGAWADDATPFCEQFSLVSHSMNAFHQTWFASTLARDDWLARVADLAVDIVAPKAGPCFRAKDVDHFMKWVRALEVGHLVEAPSASFLADDDYNPAADAEDDDVFARPEATLAPAEEPIAADPAEQFPASHQGRLDADPYDYEEDEDVSRLVDALDVDDDDDDVNEVFEDEDEDNDDEDADDDDYEIVYVDEDGNELDPDEIEDDEVVEEEEVLEGNDEVRLEFPPGQMFRLITRSDFDGLVCAVLLEELDLINDILFVHPNQMQEGEIEVSETDISTNLPYTPGIFAAFDHHLSEIRRVGKHYENHIIDPIAPSAARVVYNYFGGKKRFPDISEEMMLEVDKGDAAQFSMEEVLNPTGWPLLNFIMDSRTGLGRYRGFRVPNYELMMSLIDYCRRYPIEDILEHPDVKERVELYMEHQEPAKEQIKRCTTVHGNLAVLDLRHEDKIYVCNRFMVYALFPECNISMHVLWGRAQQNTVFAVGKSIFDRSSKTNIGELMLTYGGGGHANAGTCQADNALADVVRDALIQRINADG